MDTVQSGFCSLSTLKPTKAGGYIQVSAQGANHFAMLQEVCLWARGINVSGLDDIRSALMRGLDSQISHLCDQPACTLPEHVILESAVENNSRKNCGRVIPCPHEGCPKFIQTCVHSPRCI